MSNSDKSLAYCDKLTLCQGKYCGAGDSGQCSPNLQVWGHCDDGRDPSFLIILRDEQGNVVAHTLNTKVFDGLYARVGGLLAQRGNDVLITSQKNPGPPWSYCDHLIHTRGAGGYSLSQYLGLKSLHRYPEVTWRVQVVASPTEWIMTPDNYPLSRRCLGQWNWEAMIEAPLHIYYDPSRRQYRCDEVTIGELPSYRPPVISEVDHLISDDTSEQGYASVLVTFRTDIPAQGQVYCIDTPLGDPLSGWRSDITAPARTHVVSQTLHYDKELPKTYRYRVVAWPKRYRFVKAVKGYSEIQTITLPSSL